MSVRQWMSDEGTECADAGPSIPALELWSGAGTKVLHRPVVPRDEAGSAMGAGARGGPLR